MNCWGEPSAADLDAINSITKMLEEAGYIRREDQKFALTPARHAQDR